MDSSEQKLQELQKRHKDLASHIQDIGFIWPGTIIWRNLTCGRDGCACMKAPSMRHGPYPYWTTKKSGKTISKKLSVDEAEILESWIKNRRTIDTILEEMKKISSEALALEMKMHRNQNTDSLN